MTTAFATKPIPERVAVRAATRSRSEVRVPRLGPCRISTYSTASHGYAQVGWSEGGKHHMVTAQRAAWQYYNGPIPAGMTVDHRCRVRPCVRREHLRLRTNPDNARDNGQVRINQPTGDTCLRNHPRVAAPGGKPYCPTCQNRRRRVRRASGKKD